MIPWIRNTLSHFYSYRYNCVQLCSILIRFSPCSHTIYFDIAAKMTLLESKSDHVYSAQNSQMASHFTYNKAKNSTMAHRALQVFWYMPTLNFISTHFLPVPEHQPQWPSCWFPRVSNNNKITFLKMTHRKKYDWFYDSVQTRIHSEGNTSWKTMFISCNELWHVFELILFYSILCLKMFLMD